jgi:alkylhydroperoxidase/carboxymuconolactone decarboxylase family protein YurZ
MSASTTRELLRSLSEADERSLQDVVRPMPEWAGPSGTALDRSTRVLVELAALLAADAPIASVRWAVERAGATGVDDEELVGVLLAAGPATGGAQTVTSAPRLALALDLDPDVEVD